MQMAHGYSKGVIGRDMYSDNTLRHMSKSDLIELLMIAQHNYEAVLEAYGNSVAYSEKLLKERDDVIEISKVAKILCDAFGNECPCNFNCIDEWLPLKCKYVDDYNCDCDSVYGWEEFLRHYDERNDVEEYAK